MVCGICGFDTGSFQAFHEHKCKQHVDEMRMAILRAIRAVEADPANAVAHIKYTLSPYVPAGAAG